VDSTQPRTAYAHRARLRLVNDVEPAEVGAAVTTALCGHWGHDGPCRWPHNNDLRAADGGAEFRTVFVAPPTEEAEVRSLVDAALNGDPRWAVVESSARDLTGDERALGERLATTPQP
jgi:hypothetical protein